MSIVSYMTIMAWLLAISVYSIIASKHRSSCVGMVTTLQKLHWVATFRITQIRHQIQGPCTTVKVEKAHRSSFELGCINLHQLLM